LGALANNGGPTQTHALLFGSMAIDIGNPGFIATTLSDQRGLPFERVVGTVDIGAYEWQTVLGLNLTVDTNVDENDGDYSPGDLSLREAVGLANGSVGPDTITFDAAVFATPQTISLMLGEIEITEALAIDATALTDNVTVDALQNSRIFNITATNDDYTLAGLTLTGGRTIGNNGAFFSNSTFSGGAVRSVTTGSLTIDQSTISGNSTTGDFAIGGGIYAYGNLTLMGSMISGNSTTGSGSLGGGIGTGVLNGSGYVSLTNSTVIGNSTSNGMGGGIFAGTTVTLTSSTVNGNSTGDGDGGGISAGTVTLTSSTVSGNSTSNGNGGGISAGSVSLTNSTVSGNSVTGLFAGGGGIRSSGTVTLTGSTVTDNRAMAASFSVGGGIFSSAGSINITNSIVAGNSATSSSPDIEPGTSTFSVNYSLVGTSVTPNAGTSGNNVVTNTPQIGSLANNGGPTETHALLTGSLAIDAGDPAALPGVSMLPLLDQRGDSYGRVQNGRIDIGAFEVRETVSADFDSSGFITGYDFLLWQRGFGTAAPNATKSDGDADNDRDTDGSDLAVWEAQFGLPAPLVAAIGEQQAAGSLQEVVVSSNVAEQKRPMALAVRAATPLVAPSVVAVEETPTVVPAQLAAIAGWQMAVSPATVESPIPASIALQAAREQAFAQLTSPLPTHHDDVVDTGIAISRHLAGKHSMEAKPLWTESLLTESLWTGELFDELAAKRLF